MSGSTENRVPGAFEKPNRDDRVITVDQANRMLSLVRLIVREILHEKQELSRLHPERDRLDRKRRTLAWPERARRYEVQEEVAKREARLQKATQELETLGVSLLDADIGRVGFPTIVNGWRAVFCWRPGETELRHWHFAGETGLRIIPPSWANMAKTAPAKKS